MKAFNVVTGLPRSGSTLLCNILNQNPAFYASSTSVLPTVLMTMSNVFSMSPEVKGMLAKDEDATNDRLVKTMKGVIESWYADKKNIVVFDKSRAWGVSALMLKQLYPKAKIIVTVRDLRAVFGSTEKQHQRFPILDHAQTGMQKTVFTRADEYFSPEGVIGSAVVGVEDLMRRKPRGVVVISYEALAVDPKLTIETLYGKIGQKLFEHDFDNVENTAEDLDALYLGKFEHKGNGKVVLTDPDEWKAFVSPDLADLIMKRYPFYNRVFGYT